ncbi:hypothetical protein [Williamsoniiplasma lucivorax]|uniref:Uncharacterized protein n=1 Tax=Williamsoniiplasma lucivorax TaxID=209274 RepID=A0A2S5R919_9MOLU|nr:hypothetical protein [Williamsoniiplasma lucivorax]PPE03821.1 hypothetical protein ELUCI_v1c09660 [Williamsoniiplasma lucivorax]
MLNLYAKGGLNFEGLTKEMNDILAKFLTIAGAVLIIATVIGILRIAFQLNKMNSDEDVDVTQRKQKIWQIAWLLLALGLGIGATTIGSIMWDAVKGLQDAPIPGAKSALMSTRNLIDFKTLVHTNVSLII